MHKQPVAGLSQDSAERIGRWFKALSGDEKSQTWCALHNIALTKAGAETPDSAGGFIVPDSFDSQIINVRERVGAFRAGCEVHAATSDTPPA